MKKFIHWMYKNNLFIKYCIIYDSIYGCSKHYRCANSMWVVYVLSFTHRVIIDRCIDDTGHGIIIVYGLMDLTRHTLNRNCA